jgi:peptidoglycan/xylan/chitin deacetylase (PgdA/CDA1 family)
MIQKRSHLNTLRLVFLALLLAVDQVQAKEIALTFDDAPMDSTPFFETHSRTDELIKKLRTLNVPPVIIFSNACRRKNARSVIEQLKKYRSAGHLIGNHTCSHPLLDDAGFEAYSKDAAKGDKLLSSLLDSHKFFRFPFLNEGTDVSVRDKMRDWLKNNQYRNGFVSVDNDDYVFSFKINQAKRLKKKIDYKRVENLLVQHVAGAAAFYDDLAVKTLGRSPKHVLLLHEMDATVMFLEPLVKGLRNQGWTIISAAEAYDDEVYLEQPKNTYANNGIIAQLTMEKTGQRLGYYTSEKIKAELDRILGL